MRSTIERGVRDIDWLDQNGDLIQICVLQGYVFFGNAQELEPGNWTFLVRHQISIIKKSEEKAQ